MEKILPKGWVETTLGEIAEWGSGGTPNRAIADYYNGTIPWVKTGDLNDGLITDSNEFITELGLQKSSAKIFPKGSVVLAMYGATIGKTGILDFDSSTNQACAVAKTFFNMNKFLFLFLKSEKETFIEKGKGGAQPNISQTVIKMHKIVLPPLAEQKRIVAKLDALFAQHELMKKALDRIPQLLKYFRQQILTHAVTGKLTEQWREGKELENWKEEKLGDICNLKAGNFVPASEIRNKKEEGLFPCYGGNGLRGYVKSFTHVGRYSLIGRQGALCGNVHLVEGQFHATEHALVAKAHLNIDEIWLFHKLTSLKLNNYSKGVAQPGLSVMNLNPILIEIPSLSEQQEIVIRIESLFTKVDTMEASYQKLKEKVSSLPQAILHKAFKGELIQQLPTDGNAKDLLAEIVALKNEVKGKKK